MNESTASGRSRGMFAEYAATRDPALRDRLVEEHRLLVQFVVERYRPRVAGADIRTDDLYTWGLGGLLEAIERFDPARGLTFANFAVTRIQGAILDEARGWDWAPRKARARARRWEDGRARLAVDLGRWPTTAEAEQALGERPEPIQTRVGFEPVDAYGDGGAGREYAAFDPSAGDSDIDDLRSDLHAAILGLDRRQRAVLALLYQDGLDMAEVGALLDCSPPLVSAIKTEALRAVARRLRGVA